MDARLFRQLRVIAMAALIVSTLLLCWNGVRWAVRPGLFLWADELSNLPWLMATPYRTILHVLPQHVYNDRPVGQAVVRALYEWFGFDYRRQLLCFLSVHFANCTLVFLLFRRLRVSPPVSLAATAFFGSLNTTAQSATYIGASFDVLCTFFLLGCILTALEAKPWWWYASALLFFLALRTKEFAIVAPILLTILLVSELSGPWQRAVAMLSRRLWLHYMILLIVGLRYLSFLPSMRATIHQHDPYYLAAGFSPVLGAFSYYTALIFSMEYQRTAEILIAAAVVIILAYAIWRRRNGIIFGIVAYILTLLPVAMLPNLRLVPYVYGPQIFLILAICLFFEDVMSLLLHTESARWAGALCIALLFLTGAYAIKTSAYFRSRIAWCLNVRATSATTARDAAVQLSHIGPGSHVFIDSGNSTPWLMLAGPCDYLRLLRRDRTIACVIQKPEDALRELYVQDAAEKYFVDYHEDGSLRIRFAQLPER